MRHAFVYVLLFAAVVAPPAFAQKADVAPKPDTYICPNSAGPGAVDCFLNAVEHLYTMCRQVKSIEIIEFGYEKSDEGVNGAKSEYCVDKHRLSMTRPYQAALREATGSRSAVDQLRGLHEQLAAGAAGAEMEARRVGRRVQGTHRATLRDVQGACRRRARRAEGGARRQVGRGRRVAGQGGQGQREGDAAGRRQGRRRRSGGERDQLTPVNGAGASATTPAPESAFVDELADAFGPGGPLARALPGFRFRQQQLAMAQAVARAIAERAPLIAEAGTGTGKTFAYLVPALLYGGKVIVSTGTKTLQDQLFQRDLPTVRDALALPATLALLKGRANYVCHHHLARAAAEGRLPSREDARHLPRIVAFARASTTGDRGELADVPESASIWPLVTSTRDNCLGSECAHHGDCFVLKARKAALEADVVVVNHHLFFADVMLRDEGLTELLPACNTIVLDEAHQLPDTATLFFGEEVTAGQLAELARDAEVAARTGAREVAELPDAAAGVAPAIRKLRLALGDTPMKLARGPALERPGCSAALDELAAALDRSRPSSRCSPSAARSSGNAPRRATTAAVALARWRDAEAPTDAAASAGDAPPPRWIRWVDVTATSWQLHASPLSVADLFPRQVSASGRAWIFTSATLAVGRDFSLYQRELGLADATTGCWDSPFDYAHAGAAVRAAGPARAQLPRAHRGGGRRGAAGAARERRPRVPAVHDAARADDRARSSSPTRSRADGHDWPLLVQGDGSRSELLTRFRELGNAVLLGSQSFWEGVDVRRRCAVGRRHRQAAVRAARRSAARRAPRRACRPRAATRSSTTSCRRR